MACIEKAFGKINLCLDVVSRRSNGYHNVESIMHTVSLCDIVTVEKSDESHIEITCTNPNVPTDNSNLAYKAAKLFFEKAQIKSGVHIHIEKNIPVAAGMAGGSSDAAATLRALNKLYENPLSQSELELAGSSLGADVPFCIRGGTEGVVGIGFDFIEVKKPPEFIYLIACGAEGISTPEMYKAYDLKFSPPLVDEAPRFFTGKSEALRIALEQGDEEKIISSAFNCFEEIAIEKRPVIAEIKKRMISCGALLSMMSGSGPSVFGIFKDISLAEKAKADLLNSGIMAHIAF